MVKGLRLSEEPDSYEAYAESCGQLQSAVYDMRGFVSRARGIAKPTTPGTEWQREMSASFKGGSIQCHFGEMVRGFDEILGVQDVVSITSDNHKLRYDSHGDYVRLDDASEMNLTAEGNVFVRSYNGYQVASVSPNGVSYIDKTDIAAGQAAERRYREQQKRLSLLRDSFCARLAEWLPAILANRVYTEPPIPQYPVWNPEIQQAGFYDLTVVIQTMAEELEMALAHLQQVA